MKLVSLDPILSENRKFLDSFQEALSEVQEEEGQPLLFDGLVKRFENLFMSIAKLLGLALAREGVDTLSPRSAVAEAVRLGWITDPDFWLLALDARSGSIQGNLELTQQEHLNIMTQFATEVEVLLSLLAELKE